MKVLNILILFLVFSESAQAKRVAKVFPVDTTTGWSISTTLAPCWGGLSRKISFINLSNIPQDITIRMKDVELAFGSCDGESPTPPFGGSWTQSTSSPKCWGSGVYAPPTYTDTFTLAANDSTTRTFNVECKLERSGVSSCGINKPLTPFKTDLTDAKVNVGRTAFEITVEQDRGAILANIFAAPTSACTELGNATRFNVPVNGGRPF